MPSLAPSSTSSSKNRKTKKINSKLIPSTSQTDPITQSSKDHQLPNFPDSVEAPQLEDESDNDSNPSKSNSSKKKSLNLVQSESDSDEAPEVLSIVAGKRQIKQKEGEIDKFTKATARARRQANRLRDEKLKFNSQIRKSRIPIETEIHSEEPHSPNEQSKTNEPSETTATIIQNTKKYLDPSLFVSASRILEESKQASQARELEKSKIMASRRKKPQNLQNQNRRDIGNNTTVVLLSQTEHISPAPRPISESNFERNRLYTKPSRSRVKLPRSTVAAKAEFGTRKAGVDSSHTRAHKPALVFARS